MYSLNGLIYFGRMDSGSVRLLIFKESPLEHPQINKAYPDAIIDQSIDYNHWCSIVASVSIGGEGNGRYYVASIFHNG